MNKNNVIDILGDLTWFLGLLILQAHSYNKKEIKKDTILMTKMLQKLCMEIGLNDLEITAVIARADDKLNGTLSKAVKVMEDGVKISEEEE